MESTQTRSDPIALANAVLAARALKEKYPLETFKPYDWQLEFYKAGRTHRQRMLMAANRVGKTAAAAIEVAFHATGEYPTWWDGIRFEHPPLIWCLGVTGEQLRDVIQQQVFGLHNGQTLSGRLVRKDQIHLVVPASGTARLAKDIRVRHSSGGLSTVSLKSYSQGQAPLMGSSVDLAWIDEEPQDQSIHPQVLTRVATGDRGKGGYLMVTETPELGVTELVRSYMDDRKPSQYFLNVGWDQAPHLSEDVKREILDGLPEYQREMRSKGIPILGTGRIYTVAEDRFLVDPIKVPAHWYRCAAIDFGIDHPTAVAWVAHDRDTDTIYLTDEYSCSGELPPYHVSAIKQRSSCPIIYPHDGDNRNPGSGDTLAGVYQKAGLTFTAKFHNQDGTNHVEPGILDVHQRLRDGRLKVFRTCQKWLSEYRRYHRKNGLIVKVDDDLMDATRLAVVSVPMYGAQSWDDVNISASEPLDYRGLL